MPQDDSYGDVSDSDGSDDEYGEADPVAFTVSILKEEAGEPCVLLLLLLLLLLLRLHAAILCMPVVLICWR